MTYWHSLIDLLKWGDFDMAFTGVDSWELLLHGVGIFLWFVTVLYLINRKITNKHPARTEDAHEKHRGFNEEIVFQLLKQHADKSLETISDTIDRERKVLKELIEKGKIGNKGEDFVMNTKKFTLGVRQEETGNRLDDRDSVSDQYRKAKRLVEMGMSEKNICEQVQLPRSEIALIKRLKEG